MGKRASQHGREWQCLVMVRERLEHSGRVLHLPKAGPIASCELVALLLSPFDPNSSLSMEIPTPPSCRETKRSQQTVTGLKRAFPDQTCLSVRTLAGRKFEHC